MNITIRAILWDHKPDKKGLCPVMLCITLNRQRTYYKTGIKVDPAYWQDGVILKPFQNYDVKNIKINALISDFERGIINKEINGETITLKKAKELLQPDDGSRNDFLLHASKVLEEKKPSSKARFLVEYKELSKYCKNRLSFADITPAFLNQYYKYLIALKAHNTVINAFKFIKLVFNDARRMGITTLYPFIEFKYPKYIETDKIYLTMEECDKLFAVLDKEDIEDELKTITAYFLLECFSGIRHSDWKIYRLESMIDKQELVLQTTKTGTIIRLPIDLMPSLKKVLDYIRENKLTYDRTLQHTNRMLRLIAALAGIKKHVTTHVGRRTCATLLLSKGLSRESVAAILGISIKIVDTYAKFTSNKIRNELERVGGV